MATATQEVKACPVVEGRGPCSTTCGGGWPGTLATTEQLTAAIASGRLHPNKLGCQPLVDRAIAAQQELQSEALLFTSNTALPVVHNESSV